MRCPPVKSISPFSPQAKIDEQRFAEELSKTVVDFLDVFTNAGFSLVDHYQKIRHTVASHYGIA